MCLSNTGILVVEIRVLRLRNIANSASMLAKFIDVEVARVKTGFVAIWILCTWLNKRRSDYSSRKLSDWC